MAAFRIGRGKNDSGYEKNISQDFRSFIAETKNRYFKRSSIKMPHEENPDHPRYINGVAYTVPLQRQDPYHEFHAQRESQISSLEASLTRRGSLTQRYTKQNIKKELGWNRDVHPNRIHYYPDKGPMSPESQRRFREKRKKHLRMLPTSTSSVARIAADALEYVVVFVYSIVNRHYYSYSITLVKIVMMCISYIVYIE